jgi:hypothetical protein
MTLFAGSTLTGFSGLLSCFVPRSRNDGQRWLAQGLRIAGESNPDQSFNPVNSDSDKKNPLILKIMLQNSRAYRQLIGTL